MASTSWWKKVFHVGSSNPIRRNQSTRPMEIEVLEDRLVPATIFVTNTADGMIDLPSMINNGNGRFTAPNLRTAVEFANDRAGPDSIRLNTATYFLSDSYGGQITIESVLTIKNRFGNGDFSTIDAQEQSRIFETYGGSTVKLDHLILQNGEAPAPYYNEAVGGAILNHGRLTVINSKFIDNHAIGHSGAEGNGPRGGIGGAIYNIADTEDGEASLNIRNTLFSDNSAEGGSDYNYNGTYDGAGAEGGAISFGYGSGPSSITASTFVNNRAIAGDASFYRGASLPSGGGSGGTAYGGYSGAEGGSYGGGAGGNAFGGALAVRDDRSNYNTVNLVNDTFAYNSVIAGTGAYGGLAYGGGVANLSSISEESEPGPSQITDANVINVLNTIIAENYASYAQAGAAADDSDPSASTSGGYSDDVYGLFHSRGHNLIGNADNSFGFDYNSPLFDLFGDSYYQVDPGFDPAGLQDNGGPTPTLALSITSSAINNGSNVVQTNNFLGLGINKLKTDQRGPGFNRKVAGTVDIGSYEFQLNLDKFYSFRSASTPVTFHVPAPGLLKGGPSNLLAFLEGSPPGMGTSLSVLPDGSFFFTVPPRFNKTVKFQFRVYVDNTSDGGEGGIQSTNFVFTATIQVLPTGGRGSAGAFLGLGLGTTPPPSSGNGGNEEEQPPP